MGYLVFSQRWWKIHKPRSSSTSAISMQAQTSSWLYPPALCPHLPSGLRSENVGPTYLSPKPSSSSSRLSARSSTAAQPSKNFSNGGMIDTEFFDLVNGAQMWSFCHSSPDCSSVDDRENFKKNFEQSIRDDSDMRSYIRMQAKPEAPLLPASACKSKSTQRATEVLSDIPIL